MANNRKRRTEKIQSQMQNSLQAPKNEDYYKIFSKSNSDYKANLKGTTISLSSATVATIQSLFQNPENNYVTIGAYMEALYKKNGIVSRTLNYLLSQPTYNHNIHCELTDVTNIPDLTDYLSAASYLDMYNIKFYAPYFVKQTLINGMSFFYEIADKNTVSYMEFPLSFGRINRIEDGVYRWMIDITKIKEEMISYLPNEIVKAYQTKNRADVKKWVDNKYYILSNKAVAFCFDLGVIKNGGVAISEFAPLIIDSLLVEKAKENVEIKDNIDAVRIIHAKIPTDKDGKPTITADQAAKWDSALKRNLPSGIVGITNPFELDNITLNGSGNTKAYSTVDDAQAQMFYATGTSSAVFGSNTTSSNIVKISTAKDSAWIYNKVLPMLQNYYNYALTTFKSSGKNKWKIKFLEQNNFTKADDIKTLKDGVTLGASRTDYLASLGMSPSEFYSKLLMEQQILDIDNIMLPKQTSYTMSGVEGSGDVGRPTTDDPTDDTDRISGST